MGYKKEIYAEALKIKLDSAKAKKREYETRINLLRENNKEFRELEISLSKAGSALTMAAFSGDKVGLDELKGICDQLNSQKDVLLASAGIAKPSPYCLKCDDSGFSKGKLCDCVNEIAKKLVFDELSKSMPLSDCRFDNFDLNLYSDKPNKNGVVPRKRVGAILELCKQFVENFSSDTRSLLLIGNTGLGKTHLSLAIVSELSSRGYDVVYGSAQNLFSAAEKEHFSFSGETDAQDALLNCDLLVIDDLGTEFYSSFVASLFYNIINSRILNKKPTIINSNLDFDSLEERYNPRITSRFIGNYDMREFIGDDIRLIKNRLK